MKTPLYFGLLLFFLGNCRAAWVGYQARFKNRFNLLHDFNPNDYTDHVAWALIAGLNLLLIGSYGIFVAVVSAAFPHLAKIAMYSYVAFVVICGGYFMYRRKQYEKS